jgi:SAM-dependent methyltransferase
VDSVARYDGIAEWYDDYVHGAQAAYTTEARRLVRELVGSGSGRLLDVGCGGGAFLGLLAELGWSVVGVDVSADQLRVARPRAQAVGAELVLADATALPFAGGSFDAVAAILVSTDVEPWETLVAEAARALRPGGRFVFLATHPCFVGPHAPLTEDGRRLVGPGYRDRRRHADSPAFTRGGLRSRVGAMHVPLADLLNALPEAGLAIRRVAESAAEAPPMILAVAAEKPA